MIKGDFSLDGTPLQDLKSHYNNRILRVCDMCGEEKELSYSTYMRNKRRRKTDNFDLCYSCANKKAYQDDENRVKKASVYRTGKLASRRKDIKFSNGRKDGYIMVREAASGDFVFQHRKVIEDAIGRPLRKTEMVHHVDGDKLNNSLDNLHVCSSSDHTKLHKQLETVAFDLVRSGIIKFFNFPDGTAKYVISDPEPQIKMMPESIEFDQVALRQEPNPVASRADVDISSEVIKGVQLKVPLIASNMSTVTNADFCIELAKHGALGVLHRAAPDDWIIKETKKIAKNTEIVAVSVGTKEDQFDLCRKLIRAGANVVFVDVAHGYSESAMQMAKKIKQKWYRSAKVVLGNTINVGLLYDTFRYVDAIKIGIGSGLACTTRYTAGCYEGQFSAVQKFKKASKDFGVPVISDGGVRKPDDFVKAIGAGASSVMAGSLFAATNESAAELLEGKKIYAGMASEYVQNAWRGGLKPGTCAEGKVVRLEPSGPVQNIVEEYAGALRSGITYVGGYDIKQFQDKVRFVRIKSR